MTKQDDEFKKSADAHARTLFIQRIAMRLFNLQNPDGNWVAAPSIATARVQTRYMSVARSILEMIEREQQIDREENAHGEGFGRL